MSMKTISLKPNCINGKVYEGRFCTDHCNLMYKSTSFATWGYDAGFKLKDLIIENQMSFR